MPHISATTLGSFCKELVLQLEPIPDLLRSWNLNEEEYNELRKSTFFQQELKAAVSEVKNMGPDAGFITRCKLLAENFLPNMVGIMDNAHTPPEVKVKLFDTFTDLGRLKPAKQAANAEGGSTGRGPQVIFNFGAGMPGLPSSVAITGEVIPELEVELLAAKDA